ncbi:putative transcription factor Homeodomain-TALE-BEL family [Dioscorea sansibarensis]
MATFFHGAPEIQSDSLQTLQFMNPGFSGYPNTTAPANMVLLNSSTLSSLNPVSLSQSQQQHFVGIPLQPSTQEPANPHEISTLNGFIPRLHYNLWTPTPTNSTIDISTSSMPLAQQGSLSLSLSSQQQTPYHYHSEPAEVHPTPASSSVSFINGGIMSSSQSHVLMGSKYLKVAQQLLDEVASVGNYGLVEGDDQTVKKSSSSKVSGYSRDQSDKKEEGETSVKRAVDLTTVEKQDLQMKKAKLVTMLDEVEQRYRQYSQQMQIVVSSFEVVAGQGSARTYTSLALKTISKQFRSLRDAIAGQIRGVSKSLGEEECLLGTKVESGSRLRFVDHHLRQQRALQQLGMMQHNAWRPQRGLPERSVSVLRAWLFEHFLHPYPKDSDKIMLAKQTGLTRSQVSNWFINARVRLWKPMVEEMYLEETKEQEQNNADEKASKGDANENSMSKSGNSPGRTEQDDNRKPSPMSMKILPQAIYQNNEAVVMHSKLKKPRSTEEISGEQGYSIITGNMNHGGSFGTFHHHHHHHHHQVGEFEGFEGEPFTQRFSGNGVALTLGLSHCENLSMSGGQPAYIPFGRRLEMSSSSSNHNNNDNNQTMVHQSNGYDNINLQNRKRLAAQLLPDYVS